MTASQIRIEEVRGFFHHKDYALAFRRLLDCAMDTQNMQVYEEAIALTGQYEAQQQVSEDWLQACFRLLDTISEIDLSGGNTATEVLLVQDIAKQYRGGFSLGPVSLQICKGQVYGLVGENGNGKTTLLRILAKELTFDIGKIEYHFDTPASDNFALRTKLVYIPQRTQKWQGSLQDNLKYVLACYGTRPEEIHTRMLMVVARLGLWQYKDLKWNELSSGYKMRFELARTLLRKPEVLLLDEPLANLDILAQQTILEDLKFIANSITHPIALILSSQQLYEVERIADKIVFLKKGKYNQQDDNLQTVEALPLIVEIEATCSKAQMEAVCTSLDLEKLSFNGGQFIAQFDTRHTFSEVLKLLSEANFKITCVRNISSSSRRFFEAQ